MLLCNKLNKKTGFYQFYQAEASIRALASSYRNIYVVSLFACCRQKYDKDSPDMSNLINIDETDAANAKILKELHENLKIVNVDLTDKEEKEELTEEEEANKALL